MSCSDYSTIQGALQNMSGQAPLESVYCPFVADYGLGLGLPTFSMFFFGFFGLALTVRTQHPGPILVAGVLSAAVVGSTVASPSLRVFALVLFFAIAGVSLYIYQRMQSSL